VQLNGITASDSITINGKATWILTSKKKWWGYDNSLQAFTTGGKDFAVFLRKLSPNCSVKTTDGTHLNPGCDPYVQANGISSLASSSTEITWIITAGKKWWLYDSKGAGGAGAFTAGGNDVALTFRLISPDCTVFTDGIHQNPGCDPDVKAKGVTSFQIESTATKTTWWVLAGKKWWNYDSLANNGKGAFNYASANIGAYLATAPPACSVILNGVHQNPGCENSVKMNGFDTTSQLPSGFLATSGKSWWFLNTTSCGNDIATYFRTLDPQ